ncbi:phytoene/squalene synthase family protein [Bacillus sp. 165]|uniref:phytoene/squalene synthase family protein n=1 Tax=Bacillus sp. 165 TaxID=1529117 RepID=UPI001ADD1B7A|nr:phytoene/squalene synthase family protein [Bacillus sp. 165]MBO9128689.1 phytoene/squalene synthase family protein [Bacillus sp. 165]
MISLEKAYYKCEDIIKKNSQTFYQAFSLLPREKRNAVWAVYAFCRRVDDIVDEGDNVIEELEQFHREFVAFLEGKADREDFLWIALQDVFSKFELETKPFYELIEGQRMDVVKYTYSTYEELLHYSYHVASTVGLILLPILAPAKVEHLKQGAISLGLAMQITNILRDIGEDLERGRTYLPAQLMKAYGYTVEHLCTGTVNDSFLSLWEHLAKEAENLYNEAFKTIHLYPLTSRIPVEGAARLYRAILDEIRRNQYRVFGRKYFVPDEQKQAILSMLNKTKKEVI